jgi:general stress protein 26
MAHTIDNTEAEERLWKALKTHHTGMLGVVGGAPHHFQPMTVFVEEDTHGLWFFTRDDTDLVGQVEEGKAMFVVQGDHFHACVGGHLVAVRGDKARTDKFWNPIVAAWYPEGKDDPHLILLRFDAEDAEVWLSQAGPVRFAVEIAKANLSGTIPDVGQKASLNLS